MEGLGTYFCSGVKQRGKGERPRVTVKLAVDRKGAVDDATLKPGRFTCEASLDAVHRLRRESEAVVVGVETVVRDDPSLTVRRVPLRPDQRQPIRVVLDRSLRIPYSSTLLNDRHRTLVYYVQGPWRHMRAADIMLSKFVAPVLIDCINEPELRPEDPAPLLEVLGRLYDMGVREHIMVEGGPRTAKAFLDAACVDRAVIFEAAMEFKGDPIPSGVDENVLKKAGLMYLGSYPSGVDMVHCWSRPDLPWPAQELSDWP
uniref:Riboflavin biosynthesis protein n=1 Tax=Nannochloropsis gaditana (strain CCMP526) TaxID=1093141 RepID=I2CPJ6_NANGC